MSYVNLLDIVYPVGSICVVNGCRQMAQSPAATIGGDWIALSFASSKLGIFKDFTVKNILNTVLLDDYQIYAENSGNLNYLRIRRHETGRSTYIPETGLTIGTIDSKYAPSANSDWATAMVRCNAQSTTSPVSLLVNVTGTGDIVLQCDPTGGASGQWFYNMSASLCWPLEDDGKSAEDFNNDVVTLYQRIG